MYIYIYLYIHAYVRTHTYVYIYIHIYACVYTCIYIRIYVYMYIYSCSCTFICSNYVLSSMDSCVLRVLHSLIFIHTNIHPAKGACGRYKNELRMTSMIFISVDNVFQQSAAAGIKDNNT